MDTYSIRIVWSDEDGGYIATSPEFENLSAFGTSSGWALPTPMRARHYSGQLRVRLPKSLHARLADEAERDGVSLNTLIVTFLSERMGEVGASRTVRNQVDTLLTAPGEAADSVRPVDRLEASG